MSTGREGFLSRWSRLKREPAPAEPPAEGQGAPALPEGDALDELIASLPRIEDLVPGQSLTAFMQPWVPQVLRNAALQRMWLLDPAIRDYVDPALDYAYDYNIPGAAPGFGPMETTREAMREVSDMFDRALGRSDGDSSETAESHRHDTVTQAAALSPPEAGASQHEPPPLVAVRREETGGAVETTVKDGAEAPTSRSKADGALHNEAPQASLQKPAGRRHGGALPG